MKRLIAFIAMITMMFALALTASAESHEVEKGDNLWNIAQTYNTTVDYLMEINELESTIIHPKQIIKLHETYIVERGDTLLSIANELDIPVQQIKEWNDLTTNLIVTGQELAIYYYDSEQDDEDTHHVLATKQTTTANQSAAKSADSNVIKGKTLNVTATAYTAECTGCSGITYTGIDLNKDRHAKVIAVDPDVIPLGSEVYVEGYGYATAADIGGAIKGNRIDIHVPTKDEAYSWGVRDVTVTILD